LLDVLADAGLSEVHDLGGASKAVALRQRLENAQLIKVDPGLAQGLAHSQGNSHINDLGLPSNAAASGHLNVSLCNMFNSFDLRLTKQFKFGERSSLLLIGEVFNLFNTTTYQVNRIRTTPATPTCWCATAIRRILRDICNPRPSVGRVHSNWHCDIAFRS